MYCLYFLYQYMKNFMYHNQIVYHKPCFNLFIIHNNLFNNQGSKINKSNIFFMFQHTVFYKNFCPTLLYPLILSLSLSLYINVHMSVYTYTSHINTHTHTHTHTYIYKHVSTQDTLTRKHVR